MSRRALALVLPLWLFACTDKNAQQGAVRVVVEYPDFIPGCLRVTAWDAATGDAASEALAHDALWSKDTAVIAVYRKEGWGTKLHLSVESFERGCEGVAVEKLSTPDPIAVTSTSDVQTWTAHLMAMDLDRDGFVGTNGSPAGSDCDDGRDDVHPDALELCGAVDTNCNGLSGCADSTCAGRTCDDGDACTIGETCQSGACVGTPRVCNTPPGTCFADVGACTAGECQYAVTTGAPCALGAGAGVCANDGTCVPPSVEFDCANGRDDDGDKRIDCLDADCATKPCTDGNACTVGDSCQSGACVGTPLVCTPSSQCQRATCVAGGCVEQAAVGATCNVNGFTGTCDADAGCFAPGAAFPYAPKNFVPADLAPAGAIVFANCNAVFNSSTKTFTTACGSAPLPTINDVTLNNGKPAVVLAMRSFLLDATARLSLIGDKPVIVAVYGDATLAGVLSAASRTGGAGGAGMNPAACGLSAGGNGTPTSNGAGGGGGGGYGSAGASGGLAGGIAGSGGDGGVKAAVLDPEPLRGGCAGGSGGNTGAGAGGNGGGAVQVSVAGKLTFYGTVSSSGAGGGGGDGATNSSSGGGGGSGGTVVVEANSIVFGSNSALTANGGGGGGGGDGSQAGTGTDGAEVSATAASGGAGQGSGGGNGGPGGTSSPPGPGQSDTHAGGGGGGGAGYIFVRAAAATAACTGTPKVASPAPATVNCP